MDYLLDTHALVWWWLVDPQFSEKARTALADRTNRVLVSSATAFEIANKVRLGKWPAVGELIAVYDIALAEEGFGHLAVDRHHARQAGLLHGEHRDPFDRMIAAQALTEDLTVITRDSQIAAFGCKVLW